MRADKLKEEAAEKASDGHFNATRPVVPAKKEWKMKEIPASSTPASPTPATPAPIPDKTTLSDDEVDLLDYENSPVRVDMDITP